MSGRTDWLDWHDAYADPRSPLTRRLRIVQGHIAAWLDVRPGPVTVVSMCAGQGRDLLEVLAARADAGRVRATLIECDPRNAAIACRAADALPATITVREADAGDPASYRDAVPADLVLAAGVLGNITDDDVRATIAALPQLCAPGATVIWTRTREAPDLTPAIREWLAAEGFLERAFDAPEDLLVTVGVHHFTGEPQPLADTGLYFRFVR